MITLRNETRLEKINPIYSSVISEAITIFIDEFQDQILEIRLQGSVPRGDVIENVSDMDLICILNQDFEPSKSNSLLSHQKRLSEKLPNLTGVDLDVINEITLLNNYSYWLIVCSDSVSIYGDNKYYLEEFEISGVDLASLWNPNTFYLLSEYKKELLNINGQKKKIQRIGKLVGKDIIKSFRPVLMKKYEIFDRTIQGTFNSLIMKYPMFKEFYETLLDLYQNPTYDKQKIISVILKIENAKELLNEMTT